MPVKFRYLILICFTGSIFFCFSQQSVKRYDATAQYQIADRLVHEADEFSSKQNTNDADLGQQEKFNRNALVIFKELIDKKSAIGDSLLLQCYIKAGTLFDFFDSVTSAKKCYLSAIALKEKLPQIQDSFFFKPFLFTGGTYYNQNQFDSAIYFYKKAEQINSGYSKPLEEAGRLYNRLGAMNYETGNYRLANNYFQKAVTLLSPKNSSYDFFIVTYKMNMASILIKLEEFNAADTLLRSILPYKAHLDEINHNIGIVHLRKGDNATAINYFRQVHYENNRKAIELSYNFAEAFSNSNEKDSADMYIKKAIDQNAMINGSKKTSSLGLAYKFTADEYDSAHDYGNALMYYQKAIGQFYPAFNNTAIAAVPEKITGVFSYIQLFHTLVAKANAFDQLYQQTKKTENLEAGFAAYKSAFELTDYVARTYASDEARLFLNKIKYTAHDRAINSAMALYKLKNDPHYLEEAYLFDQRNKASALTFSLEENNVRKTSGISETVSNQQAAVKSEITRLSLKAGRIADSSELATIATTIQNDEIQLAELQEQMNKNTEYAGQMASIKVPSIKNVQQLLDKRSALLSYHLGNKELLIFCITSNSFDYVSQPINSNFSANVHLLINSLHDMNQATRYAGTNVASSLYQLLIQPALSKISNAKRLIIIPDDELNYVPFEALQDEQKKYLVENFSIQYQYSTALLQMNKKEATIAANNELGFAPFTDNLPGANYKQLAYSKEELSKLNGKVFYGRDATKTQFMQSANHYPLIQLATHAVANDELPGKSFIAFYPTNRDSVDEDILYASEIYNLRLDSTQLIILSACETGSGKLVQGEGLMSMTRAFAAAGCPNIITSLWQASDRTTAFITQRLHVYLNKNYTKDEALRSAKMDLLNSDEIPPALKTPNYWAHLVFIGNYEPERSSTVYLWAAAVLGVLILVGLVWFRRFRRFRNV